jgi:hypothetical protein
MSRSMVYKLHFWPPYKHAAHYSGKSDRLPERLADHALGRGARLPQVQVRAGGSWVIGMIAPGGTKRERQIKGHDAGRYCDVCQALKGYQSGKLNQPEALARAGWARATPHERGLLLEMFGIEQAPERIPESFPEARPFRPAPEPQVLKEITPELEALVSGLEEGWHPKARAEPEQEIEQLPAVPAPRPAPEPQAQAETETEITAEIDALAEGLTRTVEAEPELELEI